MHTTMKYVLSSTLLWVFAAAHPAAAAAQDVLEFELATLDGSAFVKLSDYANRPVLINVWGSECPPCIRETPLLKQQSVQYPDISFLGIATDDRVTSSRFVNRYQLPYPQLQAPRVPTGLLHRLGDNHGALPFTVMLNPAHQICASKAGEVNADWIADAIKKCVN